MNRAGSTLALISLVLLLLAGCGDFFKTTCRQACENANEECDFDASDEELDDCTEECLDDGDNDDPATECIAAGDSCGEILSCG